VSVKAPSRNHGEGFRERVESLLAQIPEGHVMTYGQIAALCGSPRSARIVGGIAHWAPCIGLSSCGRTGRADLDGVQGPDEQRTETYSVYGEGVAQAATQQSAKSIDRVRGSAKKQVDALCPSCDLPWHRVVNKHGGLASGYPGGKSVHKSHLDREHVAFTDADHVDIERMLWIPK